MPSRRRTRSAVKEAMSRFDREVDLENLKVQLMEMTERADRLEAENVKLRTELGQVPDKRPSTPIFDAMTEAETPAGAEKVDVTTIEPTESEAVTTGTESDTHTPPPSLERVTPPPSSSAVATPTVSLAASQAVPKTPSLTRTTSMLQTTPPPPTTSSPYQAIAQQQSVQPAVTVSTLPGLTLSRPQPQPQPQPQRPAVDPRIRDSSAGLPPVPPPGPPKHKRDSAITTTPPGQSPYKLSLNTGTGILYSDVRAPPEALENVAWEMLSKYLERIPGAPAVGDPRFFIRRILPELQNNTGPAAYLLVNAPGVCTMTLFKDKTAP